MLTLYYKPSCYYCRSVLAQAEILGVELTLKDITEDPTFVDELVALGGKKQTPFLTDDEKGTKLYDSKKIIAYLMDTYGKDGEKEGTPRVHKSDEGQNTCQ